MKERLSFQQNLLIGSLLFGLFLVLEISFSCKMGQVAGSNTFAATIGFLITGVGLPVIGVIASALSQSDSLFHMAKPVSIPYAIFLLVHYI